MINEKILELLLLDKILKEFNPRNTFTFAGKNHDYNMIRDRYIRLMAEFLEPYVIESDPKG